MATCCCAEIRHAWWQTCHPAWLRQHYDSLCPRSTRQRTPATADV